MGTRDSNPVRSSPTTRNSRANTPAVTAAPFQWRNTRKDFSSSIRATNQPIAAHTRMDTIRVGSSPFKKAVVKMPRASPAQKATPYWNTGRIHLTDTTSPALSSRRAR